MKDRRTQTLVALWLLLSALLVLFLFGASRWQLEQAIGQRVGEHLLLTLEESLFGNAAGRVNDRKALEGIGAQMNQAMAGLVRERWFSPWKRCAVRALRIDDVVVEETAMAWRIPLTFPRNGIDREAVIGVSCSPDWRVAAGAAGILGALFLLIGFTFPAPLSGAQRRWAEYLLERGYGEAEARGLVCRYPREALTLNPAQLACVEALHDPGAQNFSDVLAVVTDPRVAQLSREQADWLVLALRARPGDLPAALALARAGDSMVIDLAGSTLAIRGLDIPMSRTPLFYLAWYAQHRGRGEGWVTNPASNRPDRETGRELAALMSRFDGHARAINDLEQAGLKARTLDQNRNKIKDEIVAVLGESLAAAYLFEASRHPDGIRMRYRLGLEAAQIRVIT